MNRINWTELKPQIQQVGRLSLPAILTQITTIAMQYIDSAMVGALGANASAAIGLSQRIRTNSLQPDYHRLSLPANHYE